MSVNLQNRKLVNYCINHFCDHRQNPDSADKCLSCGNPLLINQRIRLKKPLRQFHPTHNTEIFEVEDLGEVRVMKILKWHEPKLVELIEKESYALRVIDSPNIPKSTADDLFVFSPQGTPLKLHCLVMEKIPGQNLESWVEEHGPISQNTAHSWLKQLLEILDITHRSTFFHRDVKPENIIVRPNGKLALIDFGAVQEVTDDYFVRTSINGGTTTGIGIEYKNLTIGTPGYAPLEQINGAPLPQSDFYALGRTFVRLLTGKHLFDFKSNPKDGRLIWRHKAPQIDKPFADFIDYLIAPFVGDRPQHAEVALQRLNRLPLQSKVNQITKSKPFRISAFILGFLAILGSYNLSRPLIANYFFNRGKQAEIENRLNDAQNNFQTAVKINTNTKYKISTFYFEQASRKVENPLLAKKYYKLAIKYNDNDAGAYNNLALVCQQLVDIDCVTGAYKSALKFKKTTDAWTVHYSLGNFYDTHRKYDKAQEQYELAIKSNNNAAPAINNLARLKNRDGNYTEAESLILQGLKKTDDDNIQASLYKNLAWVKLNQNEYQEAQTYLQQALEFDHQRADSYCLLAQTQEKLNLTNDAKLSWEACLSLNSSLPEVQSWRQKFFKRFF